MATISDNIMANRTSLHPSTEALLLSRAVHGGSAQPCGRVLGLEYEHHVLLCASPILYLADGLRVVFGLLLLEAYRHAVPQRLDSHLDVFGPFQSWHVGRIWSSLEFVAATIPTVPQFAWRLFRLTELIRRERYMAEHLPGLGWVIASWVYISSIGTLVIWHVAGIVLWGGLALEFALPASLVNRSAKKHERFPLGARRELYSLGLPVAFASMLLPFLLSSVLLSGILKRRVALGGQPR